MLKSGGFLSAGKRKERYDKAGWKERRNVWKYEQGITAKSILSAVVITLRPIILISQVILGQPLKKSC